MPPKGASKKAEQKVKNKIIEDKTFGLKNKNKSLKVQKYVNQVKQQVNQAGQKKVKPGDPPPLTKKEKEEQAKQELNQIFKPVTIQQKVAAGVDPKSVLCQFFKEGLCTKGSKCKFSHDLSITNKVEKINLYVDQRELEEEKAKDTMDEWDQEKLEKVVNSKHKDNRTEIVCKFFLQAIENKKYGWFWECPNGGDTCPYRHALPPGFVLKTNKKEPEDEGPKTLIEDEIEEERKRLVGEGTPVTLERFLAWKEEKRKRLEKERAEREKDAPKDKGPRSMMSGREMFVFNPELFVDDDAALGETEYEKEEDVIDPNVPHNVVTVTATSITLTKKVVDGDGDDDDDDDNEDAETADAGAVDESLFTVDDSVPDLSDEE